MSHTASTLQLDFERSFRRARSRGPQQLLLKAMKGLKPHELIVDTCCGWGEDLMCLRSMFQHVVGIERHPVIYRLLKDAQKRFSLQGVEIHWGDSMHYCGTGKVFYMDPMYPHGPRRKSLAKMETEWLKALCGRDDDQKDLLLALLAKKPKRIILKRPRKSPMLFPERVRYAVHGKLVRFDIYY